MLSMTHHQLCLYCVKLLVVHPENRKQKVKSFVLAARLVSGLLQAEDTDLITSSLVSLCPTETTTGSRRSALPVTATASGPSWDRWAQMAAHTPLGAINHKLSVRDKVHLSWGFVEWDFKQRSTDQVCLRLWGQERQMPCSLSHSPFNLPPSLYPHGPHSLVLGFSPF